MAFTKIKYQTAAGSRSTSLRMGTARVHGRIARQLIRSASDSTPQFNSAPSLFGSLWSPLRLDLLKAPLTRYRE